LSSWALVNSGPLPSPPKSIAPIMTKGLLKGGQGQNSLTYLTLPTMGGRKLQLSCHLADKEKIHCGFVINWSI
jgi:hypothetical protein